MVLLQLRQCSHSTVLQNMELENPADGAERTTCQMLSVTSGLSCP